jgi:hypothetical protein
MGAGAAPVFAGDCSRVRGESSCDYIANDFPADALEIKRLSQKIKSVKWMDCAKSKAGRQNPVDGSMMATRPITTSTMRLFYVSGQRSRN